MRIATALVGDELEVPNVVVTGTATSLAQDIVVGRHRLTADEPAATGGTDSGAGRSWSEAPRGQAAGRWNLAA